ncbi:unnamed protein product [Adineta ricciae]|uniref:Uncharacterized protein n=1 Tax=Adineta ricciae TaxID=249248 RepID=A0A815UW52_ADIRI|nr:unnamed protein product [Adineta ricciae]CAF1525255.1 unnamed protein product [Adineta ricciae]
MTNTINIINRTDRSTKLGFFPNLGPYQPSFNAERTIDIAAGENQLVELDHGWEGRIQKLTGAPNDPATWAEIHFNAFQNMTFVDISLIRGYNGSLVFTSNDGSLKTGVKDNLFFNAPNQFKLKDSQGNHVLDATEPYTGGQNMDLISYYRSRVPIGQGYIVPDDHSSSHGTQDTHIKLEIYS